jgi:hypothetical protein
LLRSVLNLGVEKTSMLFKRITMFDRAGIFEMIVEEKRGTCLAK